MATEMDKVGVCITPEEAFRRLGISRPLGYSLIHQGLLPALRMGKKRFCIPVVALEQLLAQANTNQEGKD